MNRKSLIIALSAVALIAMTASATAYLVEREDTKPVEKTTVVHQQAAPAQPQRVACNDGNIVGKALGGVGGGVLASNLGKGNGKTAATIGGTLGGAYIGGEVIPTHNVTCR